MNEILSVLHPHLKFSKRSAVSHEMCHSHRTVIIDHVCLPWGDKQCTRDAVCYLQLLDLQKALHHDHKVTRSLKGCKI